MKRALMLTQGLFYLGTGIWPLVHMKSFLFVTGPKTDLWLVHTVGTLVGAIGAGLLVSGIKNAKPSPELTVIAMGSAAALTTIDTVYAGKGRISPVYLLDAVAETTLIGWWVKCLRTEDEYPLRQRFGGHPFS